MPTAVERIVAEIESIRSRVQTLEETPQLKYSSVDDGAIAVAISETVSAYMGVQYDGTTVFATVAGPVPPQIVGVTAQTTIGGILVKWNGGFVGGAVAPMDWLRADVQVSDDPTFAEVGFGNVKGFIPSAAGGETTIAWPQAGVTLYARVVARTAAGKFSTPSATVTAKAGQVLLGDLGFDVGAYEGGKNIFFGPDTPVGGLMGDVWLFDTGTTLPIKNAAGATIAVEPLYVTRRFDGAQWNDLANQGITSSLVQAVIAQITANSKTKIHLSPDEPHDLTEANIGEIWQDIDGGNAQFVWTAATQVQRVNYAINPRFEADPPGGIVNPWGWLQFTSGAFGTATGTIEKVGETQFARIVSSSLGTLTTDRIGFQQPIKTVKFLEGDIVRVQVDAWVTVPDPQHPITLYIDWIATDGSIISSQFIQGTGNIGRQTLVGTTPALPAGVREIRCYVWRRGNAAGSALANADLNVDQLLVERNRETGTPTEYFDGASGGEAYWNGDAHKSTSTTTGIGAGSLGWQPYRLRTGAIQPNSLVASSLVATGTITAALFEAEMVLANRLIAGDLLGNHATMEPDGFHVYADIAGEGVMEVGRLAYGLDDVFGMVNRDGATTVSIDDTGVIACKAVVTEGLLVNGTDYGTKLAGFSEGIVGRFTGLHTNYIGPISTNEYGICECVAPVYAGRAYLVSVSYVYRGDSVAGDEIRARVRSTWNDPNTMTDVNQRLSSQPSKPTITSNEEGVFHHTAELTGRWYDATDSFIHYPGVTSLQRFLFTVQKGASVTAGTTGTLTIIQDSVSQLSRAATEIDFFIQDLGPVGVGQGGQFLNGGGTLASGTSGTPTGGASVSQQRDVSLSPAGWETFRGSGTKRTDTTDIVQGWDPSGANGDGRGQWWFTIPSIPANSITNLEVYLFSNHWYLASGGSAYMFLTLAGDRGPTWTSPKTGWLTAGWVRGGGKTLKLPSDWWPYFTNTPPGGVKAEGIALGPLNVTNGLYYGRFTGSSARLRIVYTA